MKLYFGLTKNIKIFLFHDILYWGSNSVLTSFLAILITSKITNGNLESIGFAVSAFLISNALVGTPFSLITRKFNPALKKNIAALGYILFGIFTLFLVFSTQIWQVILLQVILGAIEGIVYPLKWVLFSKIQEKGYEETAWSIEDFITAIVSAICVFLAGFLSERFGIESVWIIFSSFYILSGFFFLFLKINSDKVTTNL